eukprot:m.210831 g.210831  ORF g.210831 m.210831 type:complete len:92 (-) comp19021_c0_seq6:1317-1592(-)
MVPVSHSCKARIKDIETLAREVLKKDFLDEGVGRKTYAVLFKGRNNSSMNKHEIYTTIVGIVKESGTPHKLNLDDPEVGRTQESMISDRHC